VSHADQIRFFDIAARHFPEHFGGRVLDIGALDINGGPHERISPREYVGVDLAEGPNISLVSPGEDVELPTGSFDVAMSSECFEHNPHWRATLHNMIRMTRGSGLIAFSTATRGRPEHGTSRSDGGWAAPLPVASGQEYYANVTPGDVESCLDDALVPQRFMVLNDRIFDLYFLGLKTPVLPADAVRLEACHRELRSTYVIAASYGSMRAFLNNRSRRIAATVVGDPALEKIRRRWGRVVP